MSNGSLARYYQKNKEVLQKKVRERYQDLSEKEKNKMQEHVCEQLKNLSQHEKPKAI